MLLVHKSGKMEGEGRVAIVIQGSLDSMEPTTMINPSPPSMRLHDEGIWRGCFFGGGMRVGTAQVRDGLVLCTEEEQGEIRE